MDAFNHHPVIKIMVIPVLKVGKCGAEKQVKQVELTPGTVNSKLKQLPVH